MIALPVCFLLFWLWRGWDPVHGFLWGFGVALAWQVLTALRPVFSAVFRFIGSFDIGNPAKDREDIEEHPAEA